MSGKPKTRNQNDKATLQIHGLSPTLKAVFKAACYRMGLSMTDIIEDIMRKTVANTIYYERSGPKFVAYNPETKEFKGFETFLTAKQYLICNESNDKWEGKGYIAKVLYETYIDPDDNKIKITNLIDKGKNNDKR